VRIYFAVLRVIVFVVLARACSFAEAQKIVKRVVIQSAAGGLGGGSNTLVVIQRKGGKFLSDARPVSAVQVQSLVAALSAAPLTELNMTSLSITDEWLASKVDSQWSSVRARATETSQEKLFRKSFTNLNLVAHVLPSVLPSLLAPDISDYSAFCKVEVVFNDSSKLSAESYSYSAFMLPWSMKGRFTFNADISRAIAALLPADSVNKSTLEGDELASQLTYAVMASIEREWDLLGLEAHAGEALKTLRTAYEVITAELTPYLQREYGTYAYFDALKEIDLHATVRRPNFPSNVTDALVLRYADKKVEGVDAFLKSAAKYEDLALSVPWLNGYIRDNPHATVRISYVHDKSFGDKAMDVFAADMKLLGREDLIEQVKSQQADIALLLINDPNTESHWVLFPDKHMILWRYAGSSRLLKWAAKDFQGERECSDRFISCSGREITAEGTLAPGAH
jgi:hypothetical protein